ncbi:AI-2E family transporter [Acinetobacter wuhouensis]|uniref:AI-2E family transporter n=1 Tax=Acinetobacter wuhouensis TaxID=1879050 RepID=A0A385C3P6_9GAMM|nr:MULTISPECIES: AI-2E family transporter [Acinetobacter]AXQ21876.1 AI-2E family transporter [Acinetobacter wuhouensis]RZG44439.1 AI-2E family transporter [Acinetobacter wuhouensis]RZG74043.1 AI-2E family transporter [Acinetobacter wuhouensis]RZG77660.1 AI-2E family transporter [Acinetobacter sp. WCHAc060025]RZG86010.1 AI-2E family transporter [Acinetobacter sp. WCHAc060033]
MHDRTLKRIFILAGIALVLWVLYLLKPVVIPFVAAFLVAYLFSPVVDRLSKILPRWLSITVVFLGIGVVLTWAMWFVVPLVWKQLIYARDSIPAGIHWINSTFLPWVSNNFNVERMELDTDQISKVVMEYIQTNYSADSIQTMALKIAQSGLSFLSIGGTIVLIPVIAFYFLLDWNRMLEGMREFIPQKYKASTLKIVAECHSVLGAFVKGQFLVMVLLGIVYAVGLQLVGLEVGLIIGMVAGLCSIIPYLGFGVGIIAAIIACFFQFGMDPKHLLMVLAVFGVGQLIEGYILQPFLLGDKIGLSPVAVVFAVLAGAQLGGFVGMLIALPVAAVIVVLLKHLKDLYQESQFYKSENALVSIHSHGDSDVISVESDKVDLDIEIKNTQDTDESVKTDQNPHKE